MNCNINDYYSNNEIKMIKKRLKSFIMQQKQGQDGVNFESLNQMINVQKKID